MAGQAFAAERIDGVCEQFGEQADGGGFGWPEASVFSQCGSESGVVRCIHAAWVWVAAEWAGIIPRRDRGRLCRPRVTV